jgi:glucose/arabinose dehydrogenase
MKLPFITLLSVSLAGALVFSPQTAKGDPLSPIPKGTIAVELSPIVTGLGAPDYGTIVPGDTTRLFVLEQKGLILLIENGALLPSPALDMQSLVSPPFVPTNANDERGLLGLAFHPGFNDTGSPGYRTLYTYNSQLIPSGIPPTYPAPAGATQNYENAINEWKMSSSDPNVIDPTSRRKVISFGKNANNHNGGTIAFGPDGYLYLGTGDGGNANDVGPSHVEPGGNAQNLGVALGKMLRIDPLNPASTTGSPDAISTNGQYRIPASNPFQSAGNVPEIYAYGFRNPYRFAFDTATGDLIVADVGQRTIEEINKVVLGGNYGWAVKEGDFTFDRATGLTITRSPGIPAGLIDPITGPAGTLEYDHNDGISITGGFVYHGSRIPELQGKYVFGDLALTGVPVRANGRLFYANLQSGEIFEFILPQFPGGVLPDGLTVHGFGQDGAGELYLMATNTPSSGVGGIIYLMAGPLDPNTPIPTPTPPPTSSAEPVPSLKIRGAKRITTTKAKIAIKGSATGNVTHVTYRVGNSRPKRAAGGVAWRFAAKLKEGRNVIRIIAFSAGGSSAPATVVVKRKVD